MLINGDKEHAARYVWHLDSTRSLPTLFIKTV